MRILTIGDVHGTTAWKRISPKKYDLIVFLGDYLDSFTISDEAIMANFKEILRLKKAIP